MGSNHIGVSKGVPRVHVRKKSQAFELTPGHTLLISILEKLNYLLGSIGLCENYRRLDIEFIVLIGIDACRNLKGCCALLNRQFIVDL